MKWIDHTTEHDYGVVDLYEVLGKTNGVVGYALADFVANKRQQVEIRLTSANANKLWLNGRLLGQHHIYHSGTQFDQYVVRGTLQPGPNRILVKVLQNEQTESWAQVWRFQLRVCDAAGTAILSQDRIARGK